MFFVTGDTHAYIDIHKLNTTNFPVQRDLTRDDYVIVCGDFGLVWDGGKSDKWWQKWMADKPFTTLFVDGNHENHDLLGDYPVSEWNGGKVHFIQPNIIHLMRGQVFDIDGITFFTMGGAASHDKEYREEGKTWWAKEMPSAEEFAEAERNLDAVGWKVDYVLSHDAPTSIQAYLGAGRYVTDELNAFFERLLDKLEFERWYFGHYHMDMPLGKFRAIYRDVVLEEKEKVFFREAPEELSENLSSIRVYYHLTLAENVPSIQENGLVPQIGERAMEAGETEPCVFLFPSIGDLEVALDNWLGNWYDDHYGEECELAVVRVEVPGGVRIEEGGAPYECVCKDVISPEYLMFYDDLGRPLFLNSPSVDERIEKASEVFEMLDRYGHFRKENCMDKD